MSIDELLKLSGKELASGDLERGESGDGGPGSRARSGSGTIVEVELDDGSVVGDWADGDGTENEAASVSLIPVVPIREDAISLVRVTGSEAAIRSIHRRMTASQYVVHVERLAIAGSTDGSESGDAESVFEVTWSDRFKTSIAPIVSCGAHMLDARSDRDTNGWTMRFLLRDTSQLTDLMDAMTANRIPLTVRSVTNL